MTLSGKTSLDALHECCMWAHDDPLSVAYHNKRWGVPVHNDQELFAMLCLEGMQAGLSWKTILHKEKTMRNAFHQFDIDRVANMTIDECKALMDVPDMIHYLPKIRAVVANARAVKCIQAEYGNFDSYMWKWTDGARIVHHPEHLRDIPTSNDLARKISKDLKSYGCKFVGPVTTYSYLQAIGIIDDHIEGCPYKRNQQ